MSLFRIVTVLLAFAATVFAESNTSLIISGVYSNKPEGVIIGYTGTNNTLIVTSGGVLNTTNWSAVGVMAEAGFNSATVTGAGSTWSTGSGGYIGGYGSFNRLTIVAGGKMILSNDFFVAFDPASSNNSISVTGFGSIFVLPVNDEFNIGYAGSANSVTVSNGGILAARQVTVGWADTASWNSLLVYGGTVAANYVYIGEEGGNNNRILLTGASSILYATNDFVCGSAGRASRVEILNGACLLDGRGGIGWETGADSNTVIVSGAGATWSNSYELYVGLQGSHNTLIVSNGGTVWSGGWTPIGQEFDSVGNTAIVTGPGSSWVTTNIFLIGERGRSNRLEIRNGGYVSNAWYAYIGESPGESSNAHGNSVLVTGTNSRWVCHSMLRMGDDSGWNRLEVRDGAFLSASNVFVGSGSLSWSGNVVDVSGPGTVWTNTGMVYFGGFASVCAISNGPTVYSGELRSSGEDSNAPVRIVLDGTNTQWFCAGRVVVGLSSSYGFIVITNGARLTSAAGMIGQEGYDEGNSIVVTGPGSVWSNSGQVTVGNSGDDSSLIVDQGGKVFSGDASIGDYTGGDWNSARVSGSNSEWKCTGSLWMGDNDHNSLLIENGGRFSCTSAIVGWGTSNEVVVRGAGSSWSNSGSLVIGAGSVGDWNRFMVSSGAQAWSRSAILGEKYGEANATIVTGGGSVWISAGCIMIGQTGRYNRLLVEDGGAVYCRTGFVGAAAGSTGNVACVSGTGSLWSVGTRLYVGFSGVSNGLEVADGGMVCADRGYVGFTNAAGSKLVVDGGQLVLTNFLEIGDGATGSRLTIRNGGIVQDGYAVLGYYGLSSNNEAVVSGAGSVWSNSTTLAIGRLGTNNALRIERGGMVYAETVELSVNGGGGNRLVVTDPGSLLVCTGTLHTFYGSGNSILICSGATVRTIGGGSLGFNAGADSNSMIITGPGTRFVSSDNYMIGWQSCDNRFEVRDGAYIELATPSEIGSRGSRNVAVADGAGTVWTNRSDLNIGSTFSNYYGNRVEVTNGAAVYVGGHLRIGRWWDRGSNNVAAVYPGGALNVRSNLWVINGTNELRGGVIRAGKLLMTNATGRLAFDSGMLSIDAAEVANGVPLLAGGANTAVLKLGGGSFRFADGLQIATNAMVSGTGTVKVDSASFVNHGTITFGTPVSPGQIVVDGSVSQQSTGRLTFKLAGDQPGSGHDQLAVLGQYNNFGTLTVTRTTGFLPKAGQEFWLITYTNWNAVFGVQELPAWFNWSAQFTPTGLLLRVDQVDIATNGVPKAWLADHGWTNDFDAAATNDADGDRVATWEEYYAGTDPTNGASFLQCSEISHANFPNIGKIIRWNSVSGREYAIDGSTNPLTGWQELTKGIAAPVNSWTDAFDAASRHYRLRARP